MQSAYAATAAADPGTPDTDQETPSGWLGILAQNITPELRESMSLPSSDGALVAQVLERSPAEKAGLEEGDVILELDGLKIAPNGTVRYRGRFRCQFDVVVGEHFVGHKIAAHVLRSGRRFKMTMAPMAWLVPRYEYDVQPAWFTFGGVVFTRLTAEFLRAWGEKWWEKAPDNLLHAYDTGERTE